MDIAFRQVFRFSFARLAEAVRRRRRLRDEDLELLSMTDRELRDVGLTRADARFLAGTWRRPW